MNSNHKLKIVFGSMTFGKENTLGARVHNASDAGKILDVFQKYGYSELDTARIYGNGSTEEMLHELNWQERDLVMATKLYPTKVGIIADRTGYDHTPEGVRRGLVDSLKALGAGKIDMFYLHAPDRKHSFEDTLREVNILHEEGYFTRFGLSNYQSWEVAQICEICRKHGWIQPTVYQGVYHALQRRIEDELLSCLRYYGIALYAFQPLAGGFLAGRYTREQTEFEPGSRFDPKIVQGKIHQSRYWHPAYFDAVETIIVAAEKHGATVAEVALRWLKYHAKMSEENGDAIIIGASSVKHAESNLADLEKGPLPEDLIKVVEDAWPGVKGVAPNYWH